MQKLAFLLAYPLLWGVSRLPFRVLYLLSDGVFFLVYRIVKYRRKVVRNNLSLVFPALAPETRKEIERKFYAHLCDMFLETVKTMGMRPEDLDRRFTFTNLEVIREFESRGQSIMIMFPHYASWEWAIALDAHVKGRGYGIYQPLNNPYFDRWLRKVRARFGTTLISTRETSEVIARNRATGQLANYGILSDQSPMAKKARYWAPFMGIAVPVHVGAESLCKRHEIPAVYLRIRKRSRGHYQGSFVVLAERPQEIPGYGITDAFLREVEKSVRENPEYYFWTHRRWKHRNKAPKHLGSGEAGTEAGIRNKTGR